ncbi:MAG TPA: 5-(carboxyamino)imidazole ribonucleotide mutase [Pyrinomonadaceae bacterium]|nr:5-(carboxyamino)imidazole ribonucleotide mutase [Pyrinomonadaceae bacterium]
MKKSGAKRSAKRNRTRAEDDESSSQRPQPSSSPLVAVVMGSTSDWETMRHAAEVLKEFNVAHECRVVSAHRTPELMARFAREAEGRGLEVIIAGAGGAAHLPGMVAAHTTLPVLGVPVESRVLRGVDSLLSIVQMPAGVPVATLAIGQAGATNAGLLAVAILANSRESLRERLREFRRAQTDKVLEAQLPPV